MKLYSNRSLHLAIFKIYIQGNNFLISIKSIAESILHVCPFSLIKLNLSIIFCRVLFLVPIFIKIPKTANPSCLLEYIASFAFL